MELIIVLVVVMIIFRVGRLPQVGSSLGQAIRGFRRAQQGEFSEDELVSTANSEADEEEPVAKS